MVGESPGDETDEDIVLVTDSATRCFDFDRDWISPNFSFGSADLIFFGLRGRGRAAFLGGPS